MRNVYLANVLLAFTWVLVTGGFTLPNIVFGFALGALALYLVRETAGAPHYIGRLRRIASLSLLFVRELVISGWRVAVLVLKPRMDLRPGIIAYPLTVETDQEITLLANLITLTPGTLSVDVSEDRRTLFVHALDCADPEALRADIAQGFERKILEALR